MKAWLKRSKIKTIWTLKKFFALIWKISKTYKVGLAFSFVASVITFIAGLERFGCFGGNQIWRHVAVWNGEATRSVALTLGGIAALYGLALAARRNETSQKQAETAESNLFNDRLGRGVELLTHKDMTMRTVGLRVLQNLAQAQAEKSDESDLIRLILRDWIFEVGAYRSGNTKRINRFDVAVCAYILGDIVPQRKTHTIRFSLRLLDFRYLNLTRANFQNVEFTSAKMQGVRLNDVILRGADLTSAALWFADISNADMEDVKGLTQAQLDDMIYAKDQKPLNLPEHLKLPEDRSYRTGGHSWVRIFVHSGKSVEAQMRKDL